MKNNLELRKINTNDIEAQWAYTTELPTDENGLTNPYNGVSFDEYKNKVLPTLISYEHPVNMPDWFVPETYYYLWDGDCLVGEFRIRHHLTEALRNGAGGIETMLKKAGESSDVKHVHPHKFRRTMATTAIDRGMPIEQVQKLLGHEKIDTTLQYAMVKQSNVKIAHKKYIG